MRYWETVPRGPVLWEARAEPWATWVPLLCFVLHVVSWLLIFSILLVFDYAELMGLKQVRIPHPCLRPMSTILSLPYPPDNSSRLSGPFYDCLSSFSFPSETNNYRSLGLSMTPGPETGWGRVSKRVLGLISNKVVPGRGQSQLRKRA